MSNRKQPQLPPDVTPRGSLKPPPPPAPPPRVDARVVVDHQSPSPQVVWLVGRYDYEQVEIFGVFSSREKAIAACTLAAMWVAELKMDERAPDEKSPFPDVFFPEMNL